MKKIVKGFAVLAICGVMNFGFSFEKVEAAETSESKLKTEVTFDLNIESDSVDTKELYGPPPRYGPPPHRPGPPHRYDPPPHRPGPPPHYGPPPHRPGPPHRYDPPPHRPGSPPGHHPRPRW